MVVLQARHAPLAERNETLTGQYHLGSYAFNSEALSADSAISKENETNLVG